MRPIISIIGKAKSGKTTLLEGLISELNQRGYQVAVIKHTGDDFELDKVGKDSWRLSQAGGGIVAISSPHKLAMITQLERDFSPQELSRFIPGDHDLILTEGFKQASTLKIEVHLKEQGKELLCSPKQLLAIVTDEPVDIDVPQFPKDETKGLINLIEKKLLAEHLEDDVELFVNDTFVPINLFVKNLLTRILVAMVSGLKGVKEIRSLHISLRRKA